MSRQVVFCTAAGVAAVVSLASLASAQQTLEIQGANLVALYTFEEQSGTVAQDLAQNDGIQTAQQVAGTIQWQPSGLIGGALDLPGNAWLQAADAVGDNATAFTVSVWVNLDSSGGGYQGIFMSRTSNWGVAKDGGDNFDYRYDNPGTGGSSAGFDSAGGTASAAVDEWTHLAYTWRDDGTGEVYLDGAEIGTKTGASTLFNEEPVEWFIGADNGRAVNAQVDDIAVWNTALTDVEILSIYDNGLLGVGIAPPPPLGVPGDANGDGEVNSLDFEIIRANFGRDGDAEGVTLERIDGDLVNDNVIDFSDYGQWKQVSPKDADPAGVAFGPTAPEPSALLLIALSAAGVGCFTRRS